MGRDEAKKVIRSAVDEIVGRLVDVRPIYDIIVHYGSTYGYTDQVGLQIRIEVINLSEEQFYDLRVSRPYNQDDLIKALKDFELALTALINGLP
jgi:hypothetical protein